MAIYRGIGSASSTSDQATIDAVTTQATNAANSATSAASSATSAASSASSASASATTATSQASNASSSASAAASSAASAAASYDSFDDRYLGSKLSNPTVDNDGDPLVTGALYYNSTAGEMRVYNGSSWVAAYASLGGALIASNNLSDLDSAATARTNLGLGTAATTASTDYATAAQGTKADTAYGWGDHSTAGYLTTVAIDGVSDVTITTPADNEVLAYDSTSGTWINQTATEAGLLTAEVNDLTAAVTWANVPDANITQTSVTQHQAALSITEGQISNLGADIVLDSDIGVTVQGYDADTAKTDTAQTFTASQRGTVTTDNDLSFDMNVTNFFKCTPAANGTLTFTNITAGQSGNIWLDNSGGYTISAAASTYIASADLTTISTAGVYFLSYYSDGTNVMVSATPAVTSAGA